MNNKNKIKARVKLLKSVRRNTLFEKIVEQLRELTDMFSQNLLTAEEFAQAKEIVIKTFSRNET